jgi:hypothetical protein
MVAWRQHIVDVSRSGVGGGVVTAVAALVASLVYLPVLELYPLGLSSDVQYWFWYAPQFATLAGLVVGTVVWRRALSSASSPERGALMGIATAVGVVVLVPIIAGLYMILFPVLLSVATGQSVQYALTLYPAHVRSSVGITRTLAVGWSPLVGAVLLPLGAFVGWAYQRGRRPGGR